jgi:HlyD family secretion protein
MMKKHLLFYTLIIFISCALLTACHQQQKKVGKQQTITVKKQAASKTLYFSGTINPLSTTPVLSPAEGVATKQFFEFGQPIKKGQKLITISSAKQQTDYQSAITDFIKAKQTLGKDKSKYLSAKKLYQRGLKSRNDYEDAENTYYLDQLAFYQAQAKLNTAIKYHKVTDLSKLSAEDIKSVQKALNLNKTEQEITVTAPVNGIALFPKDSDSNSGGQKDTAQVKQGDILVNLGDITGLTVTIGIDEININQIHVNQKAVITSDAFPDISLNGYVKSVASQAASVGGSPTFSAIVIVPNLTPAQAKVIHIGMNAKIGIILQSPAQILLPLKAVYKKDGVSMVTIVDKTSNKKTPVTVTTGQTSLNSVVITSGLKTGDQVVVPN